MPLQLILLTPDKGRAPDLVWAPSVAKFYSLPNGSPLDQNRLPLGLNTLFCIIYSTIVYILLLFFFFWYFWKKTTQFIYTLISNIWSFWGVFFCACNQYGLDTSEFTYNPSESNRYPQAAPQQTEEGSRCTIM